MWSVYTILSRLLNLFQQTWNFNRKDFKNAITSVLLNDDDAKNEIILKMVKVVRMHFDDEQEMFEWTKDIFQKVRL